MGILEKLIYHRDPSAFRVNELAPHAYFIPYESEEASVLPRERSAYFTDLNGEWDFKYYPSIYDAEEFYTEWSSEEGFSPVSVPEVWQTHGVDGAQYQTSPYTFIFDPPHVPEKDPCGAYVKRFSLSPTEGKRYELHLEGKDSCAYVWLNGHFVGYCECPHCDSAFDITPYLKEGENKLAILVLKWCSGSYLDDQDKIRLSGLFRSVYVLERADRGIRDIRINTKNDGTVHIEVQSQADVRARLCKDGDLLCAGKLRDGACDLLVFDPLLWSAESPALYDLVLECEGETVRQRFGFREIRREGRIITLNGAPIKLYGVNRHDSSPDGGYVTSLEFMRDELCLMKRHNINAIRTSHYPNDPRFYELCNELGFYVMCEADMECHGCHYVRGWEKVVEEPTFAAAIHDRIERAYQAFKCFSCVCIWSLGNESDWGGNLWREAEYIRRADPSRLLHYEGVFHRPGVEEATEGERAVPDSEIEFILNTFSLKSRMYTTLEDLVPILSQDSRVDLPTVLCEYSHAMGNSCGDLRFYDELMQKYPSFAGAFIWEWCDHGLRLRDENGEEYFGYGGDFGEKHHRGNICMDGIVSPDRQPHSALLEAAAVFAPMRVELEGDILKFRNRACFTDLCEYAFTLSVCADGEEIHSRDLEITCPPRGEVTVALPELPRDGRDRVMYITARTRKDAPWAKSGHRVAAYSFRLEDAPEAKRRSFGAPHVSESASAFEINGEGFCYTLRKDEGVISQMSIGGEEILRAPLAFNCYRAPTDNDNSFSPVKNVYNKWRGDVSFGDIAYPELSVKELNCRIEPDRAVLGADFIFAVQGRMHISEGRIEYAIYRDGTLRITQRARINEGLNYWLPRYGYALPLSSVAENIEYFGYGPAESYEDKISHALLGRYKYIQDDPHGAYEKPQESGSHTGTEWLTFTVGGRRLRVSGGFSFCATRYDLVDMTVARHRKDLIALEGTDLYIDYRMSGVGSVSCGGQAPLPQCRIESGETVEFTVDIMPEK